MYFLNRMSLSAGVRQTDTAVLLDTSLSFIPQFKIHNDVSSEAGVTRADETELLNDLLLNNKRKPSSYGVASERLVRAEER